MPMEDSPLRRVEWQMVSKAALRSRRMTIVSEPESAVMRSLENFKRAISVL